MHVIDNSHNEIRGSRVERDAGGDEKQLIKFAWPYYVHTFPLFEVRLSLQHSHHKT